MANTTQLEGEVMIDDHTVLSGGILVHQFTNRIFKLDPWYFIIAIVVFYILTAVVANVKLTQMPLASVNTNLIEIEEIELNNEELYFVFFHDSNSELCEKMRFNIEKLIESNQEPLSFYAIDISKNIGSFYEYNVSGVPNILVFKGDKEIKRIMGIVSYKNLASIVQRMRKYA